MIIIDNTFAMRGPAIEGRGPGFGLVCGSSVSHRGRENAIRSSPATTVVRVTPRARFEALGPTGQALLIYAASRVFSTVLLAAMFLVWIRRAKRWDTLRLEIVAPVVLEALIYALTLGAAVNFFDPRNPSRGTIGLWNPAFTTQDLVFGSGIPYKLNASNIHTSTWSNLKSNIHHFVGFIH